MVGFPSPTGHRVYTRMTIRPSISVFLACVVLAPVLPGQRQSYPSGGKSDAFYEQVQRDHVDKFITSVEAQALLQEKVEPSFRVAEMAARTWGTVVVGIEIGRNGEVVHPKLISGPKALQKPVLAAVRKYKYKPYLLNGQAIVVATTVSVTTYNH